MLLAPQALEKAMYSAKLVITSAAFGMWAFSAGAVSVDPTAAMASVGRTATVCGVVASADYMVGSRANPTFLTVVNPDQPDAKRALTAVIYGHDRAKFGTPETTLQGQRVCVTGHISFFRGRPEMILSTPRQLAYSAPPSVAQLR
jgi:DNA/RNA endonuclease YhcR with UshA esterase domain